jgi:hypothetical protein
MGTNKHLHSGTNFLLLSILVGVANPADFPHAPLHERPHDRIRQDGITHHDGGMMPYPVMIGVGHAARAEKDVGIAVVGVQLV